MREPAAVCSTANNGAGELCRALPRSGATITMLAWARPYDSLGCAGVESELSCFDVWSARERNKGRLWCDVCCIDICRCVGVCMDVCIQVVKI